MHLNLPKYGSAIFWVLALPIMYVISRYNYNLFHSLADGISIVIAACAFAIIWNSRQLVDNNYFLYTGIAFLFFAFLDLMHLLGNKNMGVFPQYGNLGPTFYIVSRYIQSISLLIAPFFVNRKLNTTLVFAVYSLVTILILLSIFFWQIFPACIVEGVGLTPFKVVSDYIICLIFLGAIGLLLINRQAFDSRVLGLIVASIILSIATGLTFTLYTDPFGITNMVGHFFQIASFYLIYLAFIETSLTKPQEILYRKLKQNEENLTKNIQQLDYINAELKQEITERKQAEKAVHRAKEEWERTFDTIPDLIAILDKEHRVVRVNQSMANRLGITPSQCIGAKCHEVVHGLAQPPEFCPHALTCRDGGEHMAEVHEAILGGDFLVSTTPLRDERDQLLGSIHVARNITVRKRIEEELRQKSNHLEEVNRELESFSYSISHDLRAPLRAVKGFSQMILKKEGERFDEETRRRFQVITNNIEMMGRLIDDLLDFSRLGRQELGKGSVNMEELIGEVWQELLTIDPDRKMTLKLGPLPLSLGDRTLLRQVYGNLLGNSVKFTRGRDAAVIEAGSRIQDSETVYHVRDNGIGFDMKFCDKIFGVFQRLHSSDEYEGTGIGLALVQRIIQRHGGIIWAEGEVDKGATFYFTLPNQKD